MNEKEKAKRKRIKHVYLRCAAWVHKNTLSNRAAIFYLGKWYSGSDLERILQFQKNCLKARRTKLIFNACESGDGSWENPTVYICEGNKLHIILPDFLIDDQYPVKNLKLCIEKIIPRPYTTAIGIIDGTYSPHPNVDIAGKFCLGDAGISFYKTLRSGYVDAAVAIIKGGLLKPRWRDAHFCSRSEWLKPGEDAVKCSCCDRDLSGEDRFRCPCGSILCGDCGISCRGCDCVVCEGCRGRCLHGVLTGQRCNRCGAIETTQNRTLCGLCADLRARRMVLGEQLSGTQITYEE